MAENSALKKAVEIHLWTAITDAKTSVGVLKNNNEVIKTKDEEKK